MSVSEEFRHDYGRCNRSILNLGGKCRFWITVSRLSFLAILIFREYILNPFDLCTVFFCLYSAGVFYNTYLISDPSTAFCPSVQSSSDVNISYGFFFFFKRKRWLCCSYGPTVLRWRSRWQTLRNCNRKSALIAVYAAFAESERDAERGSGEAVAITVVLFAEMPFTFCGYLERTLFLWPT